MEILDNTEGKRLVDSLRANLDDEAKLSIISAHFSLFAFGELREELERLDSVRFLFSEPTFIQDMGRVAGAPESDIARRAQGEREKKRSLTRPWNSRCATSSTSVLSRGRVHPG